MFKDLTFKQIEKKSKRLPIFNMLTEAMSTTSTVALDILQSLFPLHLEVKADTLKCAYKLKINSCEETFFGDFWCNVTNILTI